jgi:hypothetical protein
LQNSRLIFFSEYVYNNIDAYIYVFIFASPKASSLPSELTHYNKTVESIHPSIEG